MLLISVIWFKQSVRFDQVRYFTAKHPLDQILILYIKLLAYAEYYEMIGVHVIIIEEVVKSDVIIFGFLMLLFSCGVGSGFSSAWATAAAAWAARTTGLARAPVAAAAGSAQPMQGCR